MNIIRMHIIWIYSNLMFAVRLYILCLYSSCRQRNVFGASIRTAWRCCAIKRRAGYWCCFSQVFRRLQRIERINENIGKCICLCVNCMWVHIICDTQRHGWVNINIRDSIRHCVTFSLVLNSFRTRSDTMNQMILIYIFLFLSLSLISIEIDAKY